MVFTLLTLHTQTLMMLVNEKEEKAKAERLVVGSNKVGREETKTIFRNTKER